MESSIKRTRRLPLICVLAKAKLTRLAMIIISTVERIATIRLLTM